MSKLHGCALLIGLLLFAAGCGKESPSDSAVNPGASPAPSPIPSGFAQVDRDSRELITKEATWQTPEALTVGNTERIGLSVGEGNKIKQKIKALLPSTSPITAGPVEVGPTVRASLFATGADADISPSEAVNASTGSDVQMLWTWLVHPNQPTEALTLTAHLEVPLSDGHVVTSELSLTLQVKRTLAFTLVEVGTHWGTWSGIGASVFGVIGWVAARRRNRAKAAAAASA